MLADFYIPTLPNDIQIAVQKNHFIRTKIWTVVKKRRQTFAKNGN